MTSSKIVDMVDLNVDKSSSIVSDPITAEDEKELDRKIGRPRRSYEKRKFFGYESDSVVSQSQKTSNINRSQKKKQKQSLPSPKSDRKSGGSNGISIKNAREMRKRRKKEQERAAREKEKEDKKRSKFASISAGQGNIICAAEDVTIEKETEADPSEFFWEIETIVGKRKIKGKVEYLVRWKGCEESDNTWEPRVNLCDTALEEALKYDRRQREMETKRQQDEDKLFAQDETEAANEVCDSNLDRLEEKYPKSDEVQEIQECFDYSEMENVAEMEELEKQWQWTDAEQVNFREIDRIDVNDPLAKGIIHDARVNGVPIVLTGHTGWPNFMKRWLFKTEKSHSSNISAQPKYKNKENDDIHLQKDIAKPRTENYSEKNPLADGCTAGSDSHDQRNSGNRLGDNKFIQLTEVTKDVKNSPHGNNEESDPNDNIMNNDLQLKDNFKPQFQHDEVKNIFVGMNNEKSESIEQRIDKNHPEMNTTHEIETSIQSQQKSESKQNPILDNYGKEPLNLVHPDFSWELDVQKMIDDIGNEDVPIVRRNYKETNPIHGNILASKFLKTCWLNADNKKTTTKTTHVDACTKDKKGTPSTPGNPPKLYLHQWQFPLSDTAGRKLCHQTEPLPNDIFGEDLLKYWIDLPQCRSDNPLQYIFMGKEGTMSKLHKDNGGLAITIAPIVGEKECVLVHRADGSNCLYHLTANIEKVDAIDLHKYPLVAQARIWKTIVKPGEILLMPHGTYHQCRNITPCLSYSRFHLDTVNLMPFLQSMIDGDAPELEHDEILWNASAELIKKVDKVVDESQCRIKSGKTDIPRLSDDLVRSVNTLRSLRLFIREICRRMTVRKIVKGNLKHGEVNKNNGKVNSSGTLQSEGRVVIEGNKYINSEKKSSNLQEKKVTKTAQLKSEYSSHDWDMLVDDIDLCLHEFRFRRLKKIPSFRKRRVKVLQNTLDDSFRNQVKNDLAAAPVIAYKTALELAYLSLPRVSINNSETIRAKAMIDEVEIGDNILIRFGERQTKTKVLDVVDNLPCAYVSFEDYPSLYDELLPYDMLRLPNAGGLNSEVPSDQIKPGLVVIALLGEKRQEYRGVVQYITCQKMARIYTKFSSQSLIDRWISNDFILENSWEEKKQDEIKKSGYLSTKDQWKLRAETQAHGDQN